MSTNHYSDCEDCTNKKAAELSMHHGIQSRVQTLISQKHTKIAVLPPYFWCDFEAANHHAGLRAQLADLEFQYDLNEFHSPEDRTVLCDAHLDFFKTDFKEDYVKNQDLNYL
jgi:hypothetical protein